MSSQLDRKAKNIFLSFLGNTGVKRKGNNSFISIIEIQTLFAHGIINFTSMFFSDVLRNSNTISETLEIVMQNDNLTLRNSYNGQRIGEVKQLFYGQPQSLLSLMTSEEMDLEREHFTNNRTIFFYSIWTMCLPPRLVPSRYLRVSKRKRSGSSDMCGELWKEAEEK